MKTSKLYNNFQKTPNLQMKESFKQKMQENKPPLTFKNTKKNICLERKREFFFGAQKKGELR